MLQLLQLVPFSQSPRLEKCCETENIPQEKCSKSSNTPLEKCNNHLKTPLEKCKIIVGGAYETQYLQGFIKMERKP